ncbi:MAG: hypothetical protein WCH39_01490 [Schlesneria sp.]
MTLTEMKRLVVSRPIPRLNFRDPAKRLAFALMTLAVCVQSLCATDYFLTIGGGYNPEGNQASLEANVIFFQQVLDEKHRGMRLHDIFFADGHDTASDLQVLSSNSPGRTNAAFELLASLHRGSGQETVEYRNHRVPRISGAIDPALVRSSLQKIVKGAVRKDRLIIYVTAHGSAGSESDPYNTTIDCWNGKRITAREFARWLDDLPPDVPVVMVMAQCYCGGFARTIFNEMDSSKGLSTHLRAGFFAQQHYLPAAGCRPDIKHDEEFSSYFWGAIAGRSRNGVPIATCDINGDGEVSFAEAYAYAVIVGDTIDIPLRTSDVYLRTYSRLPDDDQESSQKGADGKSDAAAENESEASARKSPLNLASVKGSLQSIVDQAPPVSRRIVTDLSKHLGFESKDDVRNVYKAYEKHLDSVPQTPRRGGRGRAGSGRRNLLREISEKWPELGDDQHWEDSPLLKMENQEKLLAEIKELPSWKSYDERRIQTEESARKAEQHELRDVKFRRLIKALEIIVLEKNLPLVATPEIVQKYRRLIDLEESSFRIQSAAN